MPSIEMKMTSIFLLANLFVSVAYKERRFLSVPNWFESWLHYLGFRNCTKDISMLVDLKGRIRQNWWAAEARYG